MKLSDRFHQILSDTADESAPAKAASLVIQAPDSPERNGLLALMYHEGIGVDVDLDRCFELAEKAAVDGHDGLAYFLLGYMCDNAETPDQAEGGPRQKYDHYDAERFYDICARIDSRWKNHAIYWLSDYFMDSARGGDPDMAVEYLETIAPDDAEAAGRLSDYYWELVVNGQLDDAELATRLFHWTSVAAELDPENYAFHLGCLYVDGIGCDADTDNAVDAFASAYASGDWRGPRSMANMLREHLPEIDDADEKNACEVEIRRLDEAADRMYGEYLRENPDERDDSLLEED